MSAAVDWDAEVDPPILCDGKLLEVADSLGSGFGAELRLLGPVWLRVDLTQRLWLVAPVSVVAVAAPASVLRFVIAVLVAGGVAVQLRWPLILAAHRKRSQMFAERLAANVAAELLSELSPHVEDIRAGQIRPELRTLVLDVATIEADHLRRSGQRSVIG